MKSENIKIIIFIKKKHVKKLNHYLVGQYCLLNFQLYIPSCKNLRVWRTQKITITFNFQLTCIYGQKKLCIQLKK